MERKKNEKRWKQCLYKPGSVSHAPLLKHKPSVIYLLRKSPCVSSILPSTVSRRNSDGTPSDDGIHELAAPRWYSPMITHRLVVSYTTFSPLPHTRHGGCFLLPTPAVADSFYFRKWGSLCCPDFPLPCLCTAATEPRHCFQRSAKVLLFGYNTKLFQIYFTDTTPTTPHLTPHHGILKTKVKNQCHISNSR